MQIDSHRRCWRYDAAPEPHQGANGIAATVAVHADQSEDETDLPRGFCRENRAERDPCIAGVAGWMDLRAANLPARLEYFSQFRRAARLPPYRAGGSWTTASCCATIFAAAPRGCASLVSPATFRPTRDNCRPPSIGIAGARNFSSLIWESRSTPSERTA